MCVAAIPLAIAPGLLFYYDVTPKMVLLYFATGWRCRLSICDVCVAARGAGGFAGFWRDVAVAVGVHGFFGAHGSLRSLAPLGGDSA